MPRLLKIGEVVKRDGVVIYAKTKEGTFLLFITNQYKLENNRIIPTRSEVKIGDKVTFTNGGNWVLLNPKLPTKNWREILEIPPGTVTISIVQNCFRKMMLKHYDAKGKNDKIVMEILQARKDALESLNNQTAHDPH
jgi:hypothetical protein